MVEHSPKLLASQEKATATTTTTTNTRGVPEAIKENQCQISEQKPFTVIRGRLCVRISP